MMIDLLSIFIAILVLEVSLGINYLIMKAAVSAGIRDALWNMEISMRNAVKTGVQEAMQEIEKTKLEGKNG